MSNGEKITKLIGDEIWIYYHVVVNKILKYKLLPIFTWQCDPVSWILWKQKCCISKKNAEGILYKSSLVEITKSNYYNCYIHRKEEVHCSYMSLTVFTHTPYPMWFGTHVHCSMTCCKCWVVSNIFWFLCYTNWIEQIDFVLTLILCLAFVWTICFFS